VLGELAHTLTAIEFLDRGDNRIALRLCLGETNGVREVAIGNIYRGLHDSILRSYIFQVNDIWNTAGRTNLIPFGAAEAHCQQPTQLLRIMYIMLNNSFR
jgi:hypothetical protein